ncbi:MAG: glutamyl-tRNA amidotransferase [Candidatus Saccharibacteria bacterium]|nr:glutamyl-tRNA amidotransferase [Candidatus Saccharibacteria bacterium]
MITPEILAKYKVTIGIECHVQLNTKTKLFSGADNDARNKEPNAVISPIDFGLPGMLPVLNKEAVILAVRAGKALESDIASVSRFDRKHYFYPDLPKGYQISQLYEPIIIGGVVRVPQEDGSVLDVRIHHAHMEEDAGKLTHYSDYSLVDLNRAGTPLIEIVSEPDMHSAVEAKAYATELYRLMTYAGVTNGDLYQGNMRFDVNISIAPLDAMELGTRAEIKNLNSFRSVERAAEYEYRRQADLLEKGERVIQETRGWDDAAQKTVSQRSKEDAQDYRYMPDPDIPPLRLTEDEIALYQSVVPRLPQYYRDAWRDLQLDRSVADSLLARRAIAELIEAVRVQAGSAATKHVAHWFASSLSDETSEITVGQDDAPRFIELSNMVTANELSSTAAKDIFNELLLGHDSPRIIAERKNILQVSDTGAIAAIVDEVLSDPASAQSVADIKEGKDKAIGFLVGQVMKRSAGTANPGLASQLIREKIKDL